MKGGVLRNEAKPATGTGAHRGTWQPKAWDHSRRARRRGRRWDGRRGGEKLNVRLKPDLRAA